MDDERLYHDLTVSLPISGVEPVKGRRPWMIDDSWFATFTICDLGTADRGPDRRTHEPDIVGQILAEKDDQT
jgi:hypothetical protein